MQSEYRLKVLSRIKEYEKLGLWDKDVEDDPETYELKPNMVDYLDKKLFSRIMNKIANRVAINYYEKQIKNKQMVIKEVIGLENFLSVKGGAVITCNHFSVYDNYAVYRIFRDYLNKGILYKVIREGNYTNFKGLFGFLFKHCNTLPLSSNFETMKMFLSAVSTLLKRGEKILIYPEQGMWWNYRKPRPMKSGAFSFAVKNGVPIIPVFITMEDTDVLDPDGFPVQAYTMHVLKPIYPDKNLSQKQNIEMIKDENYRVWKETYEKTYNIPLIYAEEDK